MRRPSLITILWHRFRLRRATRLIRRAGRLADKAVRIYPKLAR